MSTADDRPYDQESAHEESAAGRAGGRDADDTGVERHAPNSASELWDHNAYGREDGNIGGSATSGVTDTRDPRGGAPAYNIDAGDDDAVRHGDDSGRDDGTNVRETGESLTGADATAGSGRESVRDEDRDEPAPAAGRTAGRAGTARDAGDAADPGPTGPGTRGPGATERGADRRGAGDGPGDGRVAGTGRGRHLEEDSAVVRHEERLRVGTERVASGRTRLRKYVVEEPVRAEQTLVSEDVEEVRTAVTEEEREAFLAGTELPVAEDEVILYREVPVVRTVRVPYERVRLVVRRAERTEVVEDTVRKERVEVEED
ncbi:DUF2382 domain-containing protein [Kocuria sp. M1N1S27]|uniref:DUF2382 domain-containing protein n=1 Tax=Kocuria kalidii TaxID=3376283 RepID=UPI0037B5F290